MKLPQQLAQDTTEGRKTSENFDAMTEFVAELKRNVDNQIQKFQGDPNGNLVGNLGDICVDTTNMKIFLCVAGKEWTLVS